MIIFFNSKINFIIILNNLYTYIYIYIYIKYNFLKILKNYIIINSYLKYICINKKIKSLIFFQKIIKSWTLFFLNKYLILGRGFKLKKKKYISIINFNTSHNFLFIQKKLIIQKINKKKFIIISLFSNIFKIKQQFLLLFIKNIFLKKNIKLGRSLVLFKKKKQ